MTSTGNDIIALQLINTERTRRKSFYSKILSGKEIALYNELYANFISFENYVWLLWSVKESLYKFCKRNNTQLLFSPTGICLQKMDFPANSKDLKDHVVMQEGLSFLSEACYCSQVEFGSNIYYARSIMTRELIYTVVNDENEFRDIYWGIKPVDSEAYEVQAAAVRSFALNKLKTLFSGEDFKIEKNAAGYPLVVQHPQIKISFSHHGRFVAYALRLN